MITTKYLLGVRLLTANGPFVCLYATVPPAPWLFLSLKIIALSGGTALFSPEDEVQRTGKYRLFMQLTLRLLSTEEPGLKPLTTHA